MIRNISSASKALNSREGKFGAFLLVVQNIKKACCCVRGKLDYVQQLHAENAVGFSSQ